MVTFPARAALIRFAVLAALVFTGDRALAWGLGRLLLRSQTRYSVLYRGGLPADIVVVGNSRGVNGFFVPALEKTLGVKVQNLSYNALSMVLAEIVVRDWVDRHGKPRTLIIEVSNVDVANDDIEELLPYWAYSKRLRALGAAERPRAAAAADLSHLFAFNSELFLRALYYLRRTDQDWVNRYRISPALLEATRHMEPFELTARDDNLAALGRLVAFARRESIDLRLVVTPYLCEYIERATNYDAWLDQIERAAGEPVWDARCADRDVGHFADRLHLNADGAEALVASFARDGLFNASNTVPRRMDVPQR